MKTTLSVQLPTSILDAAETVVFETNEARQSLSMKIKYDFEKEWSKVTYRVQNGDVNTFAELLLHLFIREDLSFSYFPLEAADYYAIFFGEYCPSKVIRYWNSDSLLGATALAEHVRQFIDQGYADGFPTNCEYFAAICVPDSFYRVRDIIFEKVASIIERQLGENVPLIWQGYSEDEPILRISIFQLANILE